VALSKRRLCPYVKSGAVSLSKRCPAAGKFQN
jgi:hypothetical protein